MSSSEADSTAICDEIDALRRKGERLPDHLARHETGCPVCAGLRELRTEQGRVDASEGEPGWNPGEVVLDQYEIIERAGQGGQGAVYKARDLVTGQPFALKRLPPTPQAEEEVKNAARIKHPHVYNILFGRPWKEWFVIVMDWVGPTLQERLDEGVIPQKDAIAIFHGICEGVRAAHAHDVRHLDLKPANVLLRDGEVPVVADFGFASAGSFGRGRGTEKYRAPEQERGGPVDKRTDVFALGAILAKLVPEPSPRLQRVIESARSAEIERRPRTVAKLQHLVEAAVRPWFWLGIPAAAAISVAVAAGWMFLRHPSTQATAAQASMVSAEPLRTEPTASRAAAPTVEPPTLASALSAEPPPASKEGPPLATASPPRQHPSAGPAAVAASAGYAVGVEAGLVGSPATLLADDQLSGDERLSRAAQRVGAASTAGDPPACEQAAREFVAAYRRSAPSTTWNNESAAMVLFQAALRLGNAGRCDYGRAMFRLRGEVYYAGGHNGTMSEQMSDSQFAQLTNCPTGNALTRPVVVGPCCSALEQRPKDEPGHAELMGWCTLPAETPPSGIIGGIKADARRLKVTLPPECK